MTRPDKLAYTTREAAELASVSTNYVLAGIKSDGAPSSVRPLPAKFLGGRAGYRITHKALEAWIDSLPDA